MQFMLSNFRKHFFRNKNCPSVVKNKDIEFIALQAINQDKDSLERFDDFWRQKLQKKNRG